jgi:hypothetical protein
VNAFLNSSLDKDPGKQGVYCQLPDGYKDLGFLQEGEENSILQLDKALYGLRESPLLWNQEFSSTLTELGLIGSSEEPCVFVSDKVLILFYVDDILVLYRKEHEHTTVDLMDKIKGKYEIQEEGDIKCFQEYGSYVIGRIERFTSAGTPTLKK